MKRIEITVTEAVAQQLDAARGFEPRASFVKRALESALSAGERSTGSSPRSAQPPSGSAPSRTSEPESLERQAFRNVAEAVLENVVPAKPKLPEGVKTGAQLAREQNAARMARLNQGKYGKS